MPELGPAIMEKLRSFDTPTICNLIELFDVRPRNTGYLDARIRSAFPDLPPMVGFAATATFRAGAPPRGDDAYTSLAEQVERFGELAGPAIVVFQDLDDPPAAATFGEVMCTTYRAYGAAGLVTSGAGRDLHQVRAIDFPVFTSGAIAAHGYCHVPQIQVPVRVGGVTIHPNDLLHGDGNGITSIPHEVAAELADAGDDLVAAERIILDLVSGGTPPPVALRQACQEADARIAILRHQLSRARE